MPRHSSQLPVEKPSSTNHRRIALTLCGTILVVLLANAVSTWYLREHTTNGGYLLIQKKWSLLMNRRRPVETLILGDSSGNQGVIPEVFSQIVGGTALNLCTIGDLLAVNDAWMLDAYLKQYGPPKRVVIVHVYDIWYRQPKAVLFGEIPLPWGFWNRMTPPLSLTPRQTAQVFLDRFTPLYSQSQTLSYLLEHPSELPGRDRVKLTPDGFMKKTDADPRTVERDTATHLSFVRQNTALVSEANRRALAHIVKAAEAYGFDVYLVHSPIHDKLARDEAFQSYSQVLRAELTALTGLSRRVHFVPAVSFPSSQLQSSDHLTYDGALRYTKGLADAVRRVDEAQTF